MLSVLLMIVSAVTRCIWLSDTDESGFIFIVFGAILPLAANLFLALRLPVRGENYFYVTVKPVICIMLYCIYRVIRVSVNLSGSAVGIIFEIVCILLCLAQALLFYLPRPSFPNGAVLRGSPLF